MSWSERVLPWLGAHAISFILVLALIVLADILYSRAYHRQTHIVGFSRRLAKIQPPKSHPSQPKDN